MWGEGSCSLCHLVTQLQQAVNITCVLFLNRFTTTTWLCAGWKACRAPRCQKSWQFVQGLVPAGSCWWRPAINICTCGCDWTSARMMSCMHSGRNKAKEILLLLICINILNTFYFYFFLIIDKIEIMKSIFLKGFLICLMYESTLLIIKN